MKRSVWVISLVALALVASPLWAQAKPAMPPSACDPAGTWIGTGPPIPGFYDVTLIVTLNISPTDNTGKRFTGIAADANGDPTFGGLFPDADRISPGVTTAVRSSPGAFQATSIIYFTKSSPPGSFNRGQVLYFEYSSGTLTCPDGNTLVANGFLSVYSNVDRPDLVVPPLGIFGVHDQDKDDDGFADAGEAPFLRVPWTITYKRVPLLAP